MRPARALLWAERSLLLLLAVLVFTTSLLGVLVPSLLTDRYDQAVRKVLSDAAVDARDIHITATAAGAGPSNQLSSDGAMATLAESWRQLLPPRLVAITDKEEYSASTGRMPVEGRFSMLVVADRTPDTDGRITYVSGRAPQNRPHTPIVEVGLAATAAQHVDAKVGDVITLGGQGSLPKVRISGLYTARSTADPFWYGRTDFLKSIDVPMGYDKVPQIRVLLDAVGYETFFADSATFTYDYRLPVDSRRVTSGAAAGLAGDVDESRIKVSESSPVGMHFDLGTDLDGLLRSNLAQQHVAETVLNIALGGLAAIALGVLLLGCVVLLERMRAGLSTMRARGAALRQLAGLAAWTVAVVALPCSLLGLAVGGLVSGSWNPVAPLAVLGTVVLGPAVLAGWEHRRPGRNTRRDFATARSSPRRLVLEALIATLAVIGVVVLRQRGLTSDVAKHGSDPFLATVPLLLAAAAGILTLRGLPYPLRLSARLVRRGRSAVPFLGTLRAARQRPATALPLITLLLAVAMAAFALTLDQGLRHAQATAVHQTVGSDARVSRQLIADDAVRRLRAAPGVRAAVPARIEPAQLTSTDNPSVQRNVTVIGVDLAAFRSVAPVPRMSGSATGALVSPALAADLSDKKLELTWAQDVGSVTVTRTGTISDFPGEVSGAEFVVLPYRSMTVPSGTWATTVFLRGDHLDVAVLTKAAGGDPETDGALTVQTAASERAALAGAPLVTLVHDGFGWGGFAAAAFGVLALALALVLESEARGRTLAYLRTLGLGKGQLRRLVMVELAPLVLGTAVVGWLLGLALPALLGSAIDLKPYTGGVSAPYRPFDLDTTLILVGGLVVVAGIALALDATVNARRRLTDQLRMGEDS